MDDPSANQEKTVMILVLMIYQYLSTMSGLRPANKNLARRELEMDSTGRKDRFAVSMTELEELVNELQLDPNDRATMDLIIHSHHEHGVSGEFYEDTRLAMLTNERFKSAVKKTPFGSLLYPETPANSCGGESL